ncbi:MAG: hypothetical protein CMG59_04525 [Candidatus Marinimicrobia bacterium]|nr:hypothetical protein [Candidatus Neomarinimicrobiota bacterium]
MNYIIFEDTQTDLLSPFTILHATFELRTGVFTNLDRIINTISKNDTIQLYVRDEIEELLKTRFPDADINPEKFHPGICLNGKAIWNENSISKIKQEAVIFDQDVIIGFKLENEVSKNRLEKNILKRHYNANNNSNVQIINHLWDIFEYISVNIEEDYNLIKQKYKLTEQKINHNKIHNSCHIVNKDNIIFGKDSIISAGVVLDATNGPIIIDENVLIDIGALVKGPAYIGKKSIINPGAKLRESTSIGELCKVGGELEDCVIHGFSNKQHDGYLGHSYLSEWVNLGANTNVSDLKNNYSNVKVKLSADKEFDTRQQFVGSFIGDFTATAISTKFNTGTVVGVGANIFKESFEIKYFPSFVWGHNQIVDIKKFIKRCKIAMNRREIEMSKALEKRLKFLWSNSELPKNTK